MSEEDTFNALGKLPFSIVHDMVVKNDFNLDALKGTGWTHDEYKLETQQDLRNYVTLKIQLMVEMFEAMHEEDRKRNL